MYEEHGFGLWVVELKSTGRPIGICGLVKRTNSDDPDLGFALLEQHQGNGYATEAARASVRFANAELGISRLDAITNPDNERSIAVLKRLGFRYRADKVVDDGSTVAVYSN